MFFGQRCECSSSDELFQIRTSDLLLHDDDRTHMLNQSALNLNAGLWLRGFKCALVNWPLSSDCRWRCYALPNLASPSRETDLERASLEGWLPAQFSVLPRQVDRDTTPRRQSTWSPHRWLVTGPAARRYGTTIAGCGFARGCAFANNLETRCHRADDRQLTQSPPNTKQDDAPLPPRSHRAPRGAGAEGRGVQVMGALKEIKSWHGMNECEDEAGLGRSPHRRDEPGGMRRLFLHAGRQRLPPRGTGPAWLHLKDDAARLSLHRPH